MTEIQILAAIRDSNGHMEYLQILNMNLSEDKPHPRADKSLIKRMISDGLLRGDARPDSVISVTDAGLLRLRESEQLQVNKKEHKSNAPHKWINNIGKVCAFIAALAGFLASVLAIIEFFLG